MANEPPAPAKRPLRILSGVQPSGKLHLGNYFGAVKQHIALQDEGQCFFFIANYHALTTVREAAKKIADETNRRVHPADLLREYTLDVALDYLALGLDPNKVAFFKQSDVPEVAELTWILATVTNMGLLERAVSYKDKIDKGIEPSVGLFTYPVLMAADILIYRSNIVPVGQDQVQHIEMTQDMAGKFNRAFGDIFPIPEYRLDRASKVPGLVEALRQEFSLPVEILNPFQRIMQPADSTENEILEQNPGQLAVAVGLALRSFEDL